jgi:hypothetical protein
VAIQKEAPTSAELSKKKVGAERQGSVSVNTTPMTRLCQAHDASASSTHSNLRGQKPSLRMSWLARDEVQKMRLYDIRRVEKWSFANPDGSHPFVEALG